LEPGVPSWVLIIFHVCLLIRVRQDFAWLPGWSPANPVGFPEFPVGYFQFSFMIIPYIGCVILPRLA
ncbi:MAG: hypothetical protein ACM3MK_03925, partial [Chitinophagales bacterium]